MKLPAIFGIVSFLAMSPAIAQSSDPSATPNGADKAYALIGTWSCTSAAGSHGSWVFTRNGDGSIAMVNHFTPSAGRPGEFDETYAFDSAAGMWRWNSTFVNDASLKESGTATPWTDQAWSFDGKISSGKQLRMTYVFISPTSFRREFELIAGGMWTVTSTSLCTKTL